LYSAPDDDDDEENHMSALDTGRSGARAMVALRETEPKNAQEPALKRREV
jgi:hypothetical protein